jgi:hypothetical protein
VFDFAPTRALRQLSEYGIGLSPGESNPEIAVKDLVSFLPVLAYDGANMTQIDAGGILDIAMAGTSAKHVMYIIVQYGAVYPCRNPDLSRNETSINWTSHLGGETANPIRGKGIDLSRTPRELETYFDNQTKDSVYMAFCVFADSFPTFLKAKQMDVGSGLAYGWEPFRTDDGPVSFGENGHTPNPQ